jgi:hypothetical protein
MWRVDLALGWVTGTPMLNHQDCDFDLKNEISGCGCGGENQHGAFDYRYGQLHPYFRSHHSGRFADWWFEIGLTLMMDNASA